MELQSATARASSHRHRDGDLAEAALGLADARGGHGDDGGLGRRPEDWQDLAGVDQDVVDDLAGAREGGDEDRTGAAAGVGDVEYLAGGHVALAGGLDEADA